MDEVSGFAVEALVVCVLLAQLFQRKAVALRAVASCVEDGEVVELVGAAGVGIGVFARPDVVDFQ